MRKRVAKVIGPLKKVSLKRPSKKWLIRGGIALLAVLMIVQFLYPNDRMLPFAHVDGRSVGGQKRDDVAKQLNEAYANHAIDIYMGSASKPVTSPKLSDASIKVDNTERLSKLNYPWYVRLVPTSILWAGLKSNTPPAPTFGDSFTKYVDEKLMPSCREQPKDASLKAEGDKLSVVSAKPGGQCEAEGVTRSIKEIKPVITQPTVVRVTREEVAPAVTDAAARQVGDAIQSRVGSGVPLTVGSEAITIPASDVMSWLDFEATEQTLVASISTDRASAWLEKNVAPKVTVKPGVSQITTHDFTETSRQNGENGQALDIPETAGSIESVVRGESSRAMATTKVVPPTEQYTRTYSASDAGLAALMANFAKDNPGTYGISMIELDGKKRRADYNGDKQFVTASTYKLFPAYTLLKQIDNGQRSWEEHANCFNKMISVSDNACAEAFLELLGLKTITHDVQGIGLKNSTFMKEGGPYTTANDLTLLLGMLASGQNFSSAGQQRLVNAMKGNIFRRGIPAGAQGTVADKVGFLDGLLHDAAIVYGPSGTYVLAIMTDGSSWDKIAELTRQLDDLHTK